MSLNVRRVGDDDWPRQIKMLLVGNTGAGKTRMSSTAPNVLYLNAEGGMMSVRDRQPAVIDISSATDLLEVKMALSQEPKVREKLIGFPVQTVVVDTIDEVSRILMRDRVESQKKETPAIADWGWLGDQMRSILRGFRNLDLNLILCCHVRSSEDSESGRTVYNPAIQGAMGEEIAGYVDVAVLLRARRRSRLVDGQSVEEMVRYLQCAPDLQHAWIKDRSGKLGAEFEVNLEDDFKRLDALIYGDPAEELRQMSTELAPTAVKEPAKRKPPAKEKAAAAAPPPVKGTTVEDPPAPPAEPELVDPHPPLPPAAVVETPAPVAVEEVEAEAPASPAPEPEPQPAPAAAPVQAPAEAAVEAPVEPEVELTEAERAEAQYKSGPPWACTECGVMFNDRDQADISYIRYRHCLCNACFRAAKLAKAR